MEAALGVGDRECAIWVHAEGRVEEARRLLEKFCGDPRAARLRETGAAAGRKSEQERLGLKASRKRFISGRQILPVAVRPGAVTLALIWVSVAVTLLKGLGRGGALAHLLLISDYGCEGLIDVRHGQLWRLMTAIFLHFGILHMLFNMLWLRDLGGMAENRQGHGTLAAPVLVIGVL